MDGIEAELQGALPALNRLDPANRSLVDPLLSSLLPPERCAVDLVLWDWWAQLLQQTVWRLFGLNGGNFQLPVSSPSWPDLHSHLNLEDFLASGLRWIKTGCFPRLQLDYESAAKRLAQADWLVSCSASSRR